MKKVERSELLSKYSGKILGIRLYKSSQSQFLIDDFTDLEKLAVFLTELSNYESDITPDGKAFLTEYYDMEYLANFLLTKKAFAQDPNLNNKEALVSWIRTFTPMETFKFIYESRDKGGKTTKAEK